MKRVLILAPLALATLAGCSPKVDQVQNGQWEVTSELVSVDMPAAMAEQQQQARRLIGVAQANPPSCISAAEARTLVQDMRRAPPTCQVSDEVYAGGVMRTRVSCPAQGAGQPAVSLLLDGNFSATTFNVTITEEATSPAGTNEGSMRRVQRLRARRLGDCPSQPATPAMPAAPTPAGPPGAPPSAPPSAPPAGR
jgi:hypothetical protein